MDAGDEAPEADDERGPERTCIVTRAKGGPEDMLRFVVGPDGDVVPDVRARLPGRGAWVSLGAATVEAAVKRRAFARAFRREVAVDPGLAARADELLAGDALAALSFANKAGLAVSGAFKVEAALRGGTVAILLHAAEAAPQGARKLDALGKGTQGDGLPLVEIFVSGQLDLALGRTNVIHAALLAGGASDAFLRKAVRLRRYREGRPP